MQLDHVTIVAPDCDAMKDFFVDVAGMALGARPPFGVGGYWLYLRGRPVVHLIASGASATPGSTSVPPTRIDHLALRIRSGKTSQVATLARSLARDEERHHRLGAAHFTRLRHGRGLLRLGWLLRLTASRCTREHGNEQCEQARLRHNRIL